MLEALLQLSKRSVPKDFNAHTFAQYDAAFRLLLGSIYSEHFYFGSLSVRYRLAKTLMDSRQRQAQTLGVKLGWNIKILSKGPSEEVLRLVEVAESMDVASVKVSQWQGWVCQKKADSPRLTYLPLSPVLERLGEDFVVRLHELAQTHAFTRRGNQLTGVRALASYITSVDRNWTAEELRNPVQSEIFLRGVFEHFLREGYKNGEGSTVGRLVHLWRTCAVKFFEETLFPSGLVARPPSSLPMPRPIGRNEATRVTSTDAGLMHEKLLTPVPIQVSDDEAIQLIFERIDQDLSNMKTWAWNEVQRIALLIERRELLAKEGTARQVLPPCIHGPVVGSTDWNHPDHLRNGAATLLKHGYPNYHGRGQTQTDSASFFPQPKTRWAEELALPTSSLLVAHCAVIISEHPRVTPAFLEQFELYDVNGKFSGIIDTDPGFIMTGAKLRRGPTRASQDIILTERSAFTVNQILRITEPLRVHLRQHGDGAWRYLLLTCGKAFSYPRRMRSLATRTSCPFALRKLAQSFQEHLGISPHEAQATARRFTLPALRASAGVLVYFKTRSVQEMAEELGHASYRPALLDRYLPKALRQFFEERWIRIFQTGIVLQALEGSRYRLQASGFKNAEELDKFLMNHVLKVPGAAANPNLDAPTLGCPEVVFGVNEEIFATLISLDKAHAAGMSLHPKALYWTEVGREVVRLAEAKSEQRPDIIHHLQRGREIASKELVASFVCS